MSDSGWTAIARAMWTDRDFPDERWCERAAWGYLISRARYEDSSHQNLKRGQLLVSASSLATLWNWKPREVSLALQRFRRRGWLTIERRGPRLAVLTLASFDKYHPPNPPDRARWSRDGGEMVARWSRDGSPQEKQGLRQPREMDARWSRDGSAMDVRHLIRTGNQNTKLRPSNRPSATILSTSDGAAALDGGEEMLAVPPALVIAMGRNEDGSAYARFAESGPGRPVTKALRDAGFVFDGAEWLASYTRGRAALLGRIHPEGTKIMHRESKEAPASAASSEAPRPPTPEEVAAFDAALAEHKCEMSRGLLRVLSLTPIDGAVCLELGTHDVHLAIALNAFESGGGKRRRDELAQVWQAANGGEVWVAPIKVTPNVIQIEEERAKRADR